MSDNNVNNIGLTSDAVFNALLKGANFKGDLTTVTANVPSNFNDFLIQKNLIETQSISIPTMPILPLLTDADYQETSKKDSPIPDTSYTLIDSLKGGTESTNKAINNLSDNLIKATNSQNKILTKQVNAMINQTDTFKKFVETQTKSMEKLSKNIEGITKSLVLLGNQVSKASQIADYHGRSNTTMNELKYREYTKPDGKLAKEKSFYDSSVLKNKAIGDDIQSKKDTDYYKKTSDKNDSIKEKLDYEKNGNGAENSQGDKIIPREAEALKNSESAWDMKEVNSTVIDDFIGYLDDVFTGLTGQSGTVEEVVSNLDLEDPMKPLIEDAKEAIVKLYTSVYDTKDINNAS